MRVGRGYILEEFGVEALHAKTHFMTEEETVCDEFNDRIQDSSAESGNS